MEFLFDRPTAFEPQDWQLEDIEAIVHGSYSANWSEMGCYKTSTGLWLIDRKRTNEDDPSWNALIITSKAGKGTYYDAVPRCLPNYKLYDLTTTGVSEVGQDSVLWKASIDDVRLPEWDIPQIVLTHFDVFNSKMFEVLHKIKWNFILIDEAHRIKNRNTSWTKKIKKLKGKYRHVMTGTPFVNDPAELWSLLNFLDRDRWRGYWDFRRKYCKEYIDEYGYTHIIGLKEWMVDDYRNMRMELGPRRLMADVQKGIKHPIEQQILVELNTTQRRMFDEIKKTLRTLDQQGQPIGSPNVLSQLTRLRQICTATPEVVSSGFDPITQKPFTEIKLTEPSSKLDEVMNILDQIESSKVVVFSNFTDPLKLLSKRLEDAGIGYLHMQQKHSDVERYEIWKIKFPQPQYKVFLSTLALGGESINLTPAKYLIFLDRSWSPKDMLQAVGRLYRPGQKQVPEIIYIDAKRTTDQYVQKKLDTKGGWFDEIFS